MEEEYIKKKLKDEGNKGKRLKYANIKREMFEKVMQIKE